MRTQLPEALEQGRVTAGRMASDASYGPNGMFHVLGPCGRTLRIVAGVGLGWEHVSVSTEKHCPNWREMCFVKSLFWDDEEAVVQYHPPKSEYVNFHPNCLHLWRPLDAPLPLPPSVLVGPKPGEAVNLTGLLGAAAALLLSGMSRP